MRFSTVPELNEALLDLNLNREDEILVRYFFESQILGTIPPFFDFDLGKTTAYISRVENFAGGEARVTFFKGSKKNVLSFLEGFTMARYMYKQGVKPCVSK